MIHSKNKLSLFRHTFVKWKTNIITFHLSPLSINFVIFYKQLFLKKYYLQIFSTYNSCMNFLRIYVVGKKNLLVNWWWIMVDKWCFFFLLWRRHDCRREWAFIKGPLFPRLQGNNITNNFLTSLVYVNSLGVWIIYFTC